MTQSERTAIERLRAEGSTIYKMSWPDLLEVDKDGRVFFTEIKKLGDRLSGRQKKCFLQLEKLGFNVKIVIVGRDKMDEYPLDVLKKKDPPLLTTSEKRALDIVTNEKGQKGKGKLLRELESEVEGMVKEKESEPKFVDMFDEIRSGLAKKQSGSQSEPASEPNETLEKDSS